MSNKCITCGKAVYPMDPHVNLDGSLYHKICAKCGECGCQITVSNFTKVDSGLLCKTHYMKKFKESGGVYAGGDKYKHFAPSTALAKESSVKSGGGVFAPSKSTPSLDVSSKAKAIQFGRALPGMANVALKKVGKSNDSSEENPVVNTPASSQDGAVKTAIQPRNETEAAEHAVEKQKEEQQVQKCDEFNSEVTTTNEGGGGEHQQLAHPTELSMESVFEAINTESA